MCGRYALTATEEALARKFLVAHLGEVKPRYNIAPSDPVLAVRESRDTGRREATYLNWGLIPSWADDIKIGYRMTNARSETAVEKPAFRAAMKYRRCILPASGFYEWKRVGRQKQPFYFTSPAGDPLGLAAIWEHWQHADGSAIQSCSLLTTGPNRVMEPIHDRMPVILAPADYGRWLDPDNEQPASLGGLLRPCPEAELTCYPVSTAVNSVKHDGPELVERFDHDGESREPFEQGDLFSPWNE